MTTSQADDEQGSISAAFALMALIAMSMVGLIMVQGMSLTALSATREAAENGARAGSQQVDLTHLFETNEVVLNDIEASRAAREYLSKFPELTVDRITVNGPEITITVSQTVTGTLGYGSKTVRSTQSAIAVQGVDDEE